MPVTAGAEDNGDGQGIILREHKILSCHVMIVKLLSGLTIILLYNVKYVSSKSSDVGAVTPGCAPRNHTTAARCDSLAMLTLVV